MTARARAPVIDADAHVVEANHTWDYLEPSQAKYRPVLADHPSDPTRSAWLIDGQPGVGFVTEFPEVEEIEQISQRAGRNMTTERASRELADVALRLSHMDDIGVDIQVLHNSMFLFRRTADPDAEAALCRAWNRWMADVWQSANGRLRWACIIPTLMLDEAIVQMREAKDNGAVGVFLRPFDDDRVVIDPYYYPIFEEASRLGLAATVHQGNGNEANYDLFWGMDATLSTKMFAINRAPTMMACMFLVMSEVPTLFPNLRWAFIEASAQWMPWVFIEASRRFRAEGQEFPGDIFARCNTFVTCQTDDDVPWILRYAGDSCLIIGTDYGHIDPASELDAISLLNARADIDDSTKDRILRHNPSALFAL